MKKLFFLIAIISLHIIPVRVLGQFVPSAQWVALPGAQSFSNGRAVAVDRWNNVYITGVFSGIMNVGALTINSTGLQDGFIAKYDASGNIKWLKSYGGPNDNALLRIAVNNKGDCYASGYFQDSLVTSQQVLHAGPHAHTGLLIKLDSNGIEQWAKREDVDRITNVIVDRNDDIICSGWFNPPYAIFNSTDTFNLAAGIVTHVFVAKYDANGIYKGAYFSQGGSNGASMAYKKSDNTIYLACNAGADLGGLSWPVSSGNLGVGSTCIEKFDSTGNGLWVSCSDGYAFCPACGGDLYPGTIAIDSAGAGYITGIYDECKIYSAGAAWNDTLQPIGNGDIYLIKYNANGSFAWARKGGGVDMEFEGDVAVDRNANPIITGGFSREASFESDTLKGTFGGKSIFIAQYDSGGNLKWAYKPIGNGQGNAITTDAQGNIYTTGQYTGNSLSFGNITLSNIGPGNFYLAKLTPPSTGLHDIPASISKIIVAPNPANTAFDLSLSPNIFSQLYIADATGREVLQVPVIKGQTAISINTQAWPAGFYILRAVGGNSVNTQKIIITH